MYIWDSELKTSFTGEIELNGEKIPYTFTKESKGEYAKIWENRFSLDIKEPKPLAFDVKRSATLMEIDNLYKNVIKWDTIYYKGAIFNISNEILDYLTFKYKLCDSDTIKIKDSVINTFEFSKEELEEILKTIMDIRCEIYESYIENKALVEKSETFKDLEKEDFLYTYTSGTILSYIEE